MGWPWKEVILVSWDFLRVPLPFPEQRRHQPGVNVEMGPSGAIRGVPQLPDPMPALLWPHRGCVRGPGGVWGLGRRKRRGEEKLLPSPAQRGWSWSHTGNVGSESIQPGLGGEEEERSIPWSQSTWNQPLWSC